MTKLYLGVEANNLVRFEDELKQNKYPLISYHYFKDKGLSWLQGNKELICDSGAFTFMSASKAPSKTALIEYANRYAQFVIDNDIPYYVELDVDSIFGYEFALQLREILENKVGRPCVPIWHVSRGKEDFIDMCKRYDYAGVGGIVTKEQIAKHKDKYHLLNKLARDNGCKLHGMGFTPTKDLNSYGFYSVDSTSWKSGGRFGTIYQYSNGQLLTKKKPSGTRLKDYTKLDIHNVKQWIKYQQFAEKGVTK
ncbi:hypothetical protein NHG29_01795 [Aerococcaceae bacterium NML160702]|nr:hypothetical protein [Aerococcaceae bacterium NML160702]